MKKTIATVLGVLLLGAAAIPCQAQAPSGGRQLAPGSALAAPSTPEEIAAAKPNPQAPGFRLPLPPLDQMDPVLREQFIANAENLHTPIGPRTALLLSPKVGTALNAVSTALGANSELAQDLYELTILMVAREWDSQFEWWVHGPQAEKAGVPADAVEAIRVDKIPKFTKPAEEATYFYLRELLSPAHKVSDANYARLLGIIGAKQLVELNVLAGYYGTVAMNLVAHNVPLRAGIKPPLPPRRR